MTAPPLLAVRDLEVAFLADEGRVRAVRGVSFDVPPHRTVAIVGESGSGKTVISQAILGILPKNARAEAGSVWYADPRTDDAPPVDLLALPQEGPERRAIRGGRISIIFQEPMSSLSPLHTIGDQIGEALRLHRDASREEARARTVEMLGRVGFKKPAEAVDRYTFELSGGLRQRAMIAMALICGPALLIADEPTTALDVTIQAQILKLIKDLQAEMGMSVLFITHDLGVVANMADEVVVLYRGRVMERGPAPDLLREPRHPYLKALLRAVPRLHTDRDERLQGINDIVGRRRPGALAAPPSAEGERARTGRAPARGSRALRKGPSPVRRSGPAGPRRRARRPVVVAGRRRLVHDPPRRVLRGRGRERLGQDDRQQDDHARPHRRRRPGRLPAPGGPGRRPGPRRGPGCGRSAATSSTSSRTRSARSTRA
jgi:ABC-type dipeptide/oligopeptide/nickel transport system ATPase component